MESSLLRCPRRQGEMEEGFIANAPVELTEFWVEGEADAKLWTFRGRKEWKQRRKYEIETYRCIRCGYIESYARKEKVEH